MQVLYCLKHRSNLLQALVLFFMYVILSPIKVFHYRFYLLGIYIIFIIACYCYRDLKMENIMLDSTKQLIKIVGKSHINAIHGWGVYFRCYQPVECGFMFQTSDCRTCGLRGRLSGLRVGRWSTQHPSCLWTDGGTGRRWTCGACRSHLLLYIVFCRSLETMSQEFLLINGCEVL